MQKTKIGITQQPTSYLRIHLDLRDLEATMQENGIVEFNGVELAFETSDALAAATRSAGLNDAFAELVFQQFRTAMNAQFLYERMRGR